MNIENKKTELPGPDDTTLDYAAILAIVVKPVPKGMDIEEMTKRADLLCKLQASGDTIELNEEDTVYLRSIWKGFSNWTEVNDDIVALGREVAAK